MLYDGSRVDLLDQEIAWEVDWAYKWAEGVGQASLYSQLTNQKGGVILLTKDKRADQRYLLRARIACSSAGLILVVKTVDDIERMATLGRLKKRSIIRTLRIRKSLRGGSLMFKRILAHPMN